MQTFTSKGTSINRDKLPRVYRFPFPSGSKVVDYGCGRFVDHLKRSASERGLLWLGFDPFNRTPEQNSAAIDAMQNRTADYVICSNVLNVIDSDSVVDDVIKTVSDAARVAAVFTVYEGNGSGIGKQTGPDAYQRNEKRSAYVDRIAAAGYNVTRKGEYIIVSGRG